MSRVGTSRRRLSNSLAGFEGDRDSAFVTHEHEIHGSAKPLELLLDCHQLSCAPFSPALEGVVDVLHKTLHLLNSSQIKAIHHRNPRTLFFSFLSSL